MLTSPLHKTWSCAIQSELAGVPGLEYLVIADKASVQDVTSETHHLPKSTEVTEVRKAPLLDKPCRMNPAGFLNRDMTNRAPLLVSHF